MAKTQTILSVSPEFLSSAYKQVTVELCRKSLFAFIEEFWNEVSNDTFQPNWHIEYICSELEKVAKRVGSNLPKKHDIIINIPPGMSKTSMVSIFFPVWCWLTWPWMKFITASYSGTLSLESAEYSRDLIRSQKFNGFFPELSVKQDKDTKSNFRIQKTGEDGMIMLGGNRYSTSVGGTLTGFHGHIIIVDDPIDPNRAMSEVELKNANNWLDQTLSTRKTDKEISTMVMIMQRLHENDPTGHILAKKKANVKHISLPGEIKNYHSTLKPAELAERYVDGLLDPNRMNWSVLKDLEADLGQYGYAGQIGQRPTPPGGGMFKVDHLSVVETLPANGIEGIIRAWDKAGTIGGGAYTVGLKLYRFATGKFVIADVVRGQWSSEEREAIIRHTAEADGRNVMICIEQEGGSGGKESAEATVRNLAGYTVRVDHPTGDKVYRADPVSVQVNNGNVMLLRGNWNTAFVEELRNFPFGTYKDQVDALSMAFNQLVQKKQAGPLMRRH